MTAYPSMHFRRFVLIGFIVLWEAPLSGNPQDTSSVQLSVAAIEDSMDQQFNRIEDYTARVKISVSMPRLRMPTKEVKLYYKHPDKVKIEAEGFAVVPRASLGVSPAEMMKDLVKARVTGTVSKGGRRTWIVEGEIHPDSVRFPVFDHGGPEDMKLRMRLWIDGEGWYISRVETLLDTMTVMVVELMFREYDNHVWLPEVTELTLFVSGEYLERIGDREPMGGPFGEFNGQAGDRGKKDFEGRVKLEYSDYRVNTSLEDRIFREDN